jgi:arylsulfatase A-like enzyme
MRTGSDTAGYTIRNAILITFDSVRADLVAEAKAGDLPAICSLRDGGAFFRKSIVQMPSTVPSHTSMLTGLYPARTSVRDGHHKVPNGVPTIFSMLGKAGVRTFASLGTGMLATRGIEGIQQRVPFRLSALAKAIETLRGGRFFVFVHYWDTHTPYETTLPGHNLTDILLNRLRIAELFKHVRVLRRISDCVWLRRVERIRKLMRAGDGRIVPAIKDGYKKSLAKADRFVGKLLKILRAAGVADDTLLILTADHGDSFNEHDEIHRAADKRYEHGQFLYDNVITVPLIFYGPKSGPAQMFDRQVQQIDILPTILDAMGVDCEEQLDGKSLWGGCTGEQQDVETQFAFSEVVRDQWGIERRCVRTPRFKLIRDYKNNTHELYDLKADPQETKNLWPFDLCTEKTRLVSELEAFAGIAAGRVQSYAEGEQRQIEQTLRNLGYLD